MMQRYTRAERKHPEYLYLFMREDIVMGIPTQTLAISRGKAYPNTCSEMGRHT
jgi:hypothetical protein